MNSRRDLSQKPLLSPPPPSTQIYYQQRQSCPLIEVNQQDKDKEGNPVFEKWWTRWRSCRSPKDRHCYLHWSSLQAICDHLGGGRGWRDRKEGLLLKQPTRQRGQERHSRRSKILIFINTWWPDHEKISNGELWQRGEQQPVGEQILKRKGDWIGHTLRKAPSNSTRQALRW